MTEESQMNCRSCLSTIVLAAIWFCLLSGSVGRCQDVAAPSVGGTTFGTGPGDRVASSVGQVAGLAVRSLRKDVYRLGPGDTLSVHVQGRSGTYYRARPEAAANEDPTLVCVAPTGEIYLPLIGSIEALGKTVAEVESLVRSSLAKYFKHFTVSVSLVQPRGLYIWASGEVANAGLHALPAAATVSYGALQAGITPTGSVRRVGFARNGKKQTVDLYKMLVLGDIESDFDLQPGDSICVPAVTRYVDITGEVIRGGRYEMVTLAGETENFRIRDLLELAIATLPTAALDKAFVERIGEDGKKIAISVDLHAQTNLHDADMVLQPGDTVVIPSISSFQPMIRLIGEFKGDGIYQRAPVSPGTATAQVENIQYKGGIYFLKQGQTLLDVITATGGVTPQADLKCARIERLDSEQPGRTRSIPIDLERLLVRRDEAADIVLMNGDTLVLPALADKVHVFGEVRQPGSYAYAPNRRLIDYLGDASGPNEIAKLTQVSVVRVAADKPKILRFNAKSAIRGTSLTGNPVLEPGDIVYVPSKIIAGWRDAMQLVLSSLTLTSLLK